MRYLARGEIPGCFLSTFNVPNLITKLPFYRTDVSLGSADTGSLPRIIGNTGYGGYNAGRQVSGAFYQLSLTAQGAHPLNEITENAFLAFDSLRVSTAYSRSDNWVVPKHIVMWYVIKY